MRKVTEFVALAFAFSWTVALGYRAVGGDVTDASFAAVAVVYMFGPFFAAVAVQARHGDGLLEPLGIRFVASRWLVVAWLTPAAVALLAVAFAVAHPDGALATNAATIVESYGPSVSPDRAASLTESLSGVPLSYIVGSVLVTGLVAGATVNAVAAFGEETGWRGLMLHELRDEKFWRVSAIVGLIWGVWHAPLVAQGYNYPSNPAVGVVAMIGFTLLATPLLNYVRLKAGTVVAPSVFHGTVNATASVSVIAVAGVSRLVTGAGIATMAALAVANAVMVAYDHWSGDGVTTSHVGDFL